MTAADATGRFRRATCVVAGAILALGLLAVVPSAPASAAGPTFHDGAGIHVVAVQQIDARQYDVTMSTAALARQVHVRILVPADYRTSTRRYPTLQLYTGTGGTSADWVVAGHAESLTAGLPLIVVMPDVMFGTAGWFADWEDQHTSLGAARWETFHIRQLIPWVDANLRTRPSRSGRAIAGLSQGAFGSLGYPARHPDQFVSAASFSGAVNIAWGADASLGHGFVTATEAGAGIPTGAIFGDPATEEINWQGHDPASLAANLRDLDTWLYTGNGTAGPFDDPTDPSFPVTSAIEVIAHQLTHDFVTRARQVGTPAHLDDYGPGTHSFPYWTRDLKSYLQHIMRDFAQAPAHPSVRFQSIDATWSQWGFTVHLRRTAPREWSELNGATSKGFTLRATGAASVVTAAYYRPGSSKRVTATTATGTKTWRVIADASGRLHLRLNLGGTAPTVVLGHPALPTSNTRVSITATSTT